MLQQILSDMFIEPELLAELSEEQKQILFFKMREEQIRRWKERESSLEEAANPEPRERKSNKKSVKWRHGANDEVWVWVMGEHPSDTPYDVICQEIARGQPQQQAQQEIEAQRKTEDNISKISESQDDVKWHKNEVINIKKEKGDEARSTMHEERETTHSATEKKKEVVNKHEEEIKEVKEERSQDIYTSTKEKQEVVHNLDKEDSVWKESLRKSKAADEHRRSIAKQAREDYKRLSMKAIEMANVSAVTNSIGTGQVERPPIPPKPKARNLESNNGTFNRRPGLKRSTSSANREGIVRWFKEEQFPLRAGFDKAGDHIAPWFHGIISRLEAEELLNTQVPGSFLIRVSEKIKGYVLSYRSEEGYKHFMIDASTDSYGFLGVDQLHHSTLTDLVAYHQVEPITFIGKELLLYPCNQQENACNYKELFN